MQTTDPVRNVLFIMCDQLRWDYLSCYGHPTLQTPHLDQLAASGVRFDRAYVQSPICGSSRMSYYTGRYVHSHGASWNGIPLKVSELTLGDYMRDLGRETVLVGKTHMNADEDGMARLGIDPQSTAGRRVAESGFDLFDRHDGLHSSGPLGRYDPRIPLYEDYLRSHGFEGDNPWQSWANAVVDDEGRIRSGFLLRNNRFPSRLPEEHTETPYTTRRAMAYMDQAGDRPWCMHLSYIKPHWPCVAPAPYHNMYTADDIKPVVRSNDERNDPHPVYEGFMSHRASKAFSKDEVREAVVPAYMGLVKQIDDQLGVLFNYLETSGLKEHTLIAFTSDHGDYLGDHWMGEKDLFHDASVRVPLIIYDPRASANDSRGTVCTDLVESIDLVPTFIDACGEPSIPDVLEGQSLAPILRNDSGRQKRECVFSEYDYSPTPTGAKTGMRARDCRLFMIFDGRWKYVHAISMRPMLFDLENDPDELRDLGNDPAFAERIESMRSILGHWSLRFAARTTRSDSQVAESRDTSTHKGILIGFESEEDLPEEIRAHLVNSLNH